MSVGRERVGLVGVVATDDDQSDAGCQRGDGLEQFGVALLGDQPSDGADDDGVVVGSPLRTQRPPLFGGEPAGTEAVEVDAVAEVAHLRRAASRNRRIVSTSSTFCTSSTSDQREANASRA